MDVSIRTSSILCFPTFWYESFNLFGKKKEKEREKKKRSTSKLGICSASLQRKWLVHEQFDPKMEQQSDYWKKKTFSRPVLDRHRGKRLGIQTEAIVQASEKENRQKLIRE